MCNLTFLNKSYFNFFYTFCQFFFKKILQEYFKFLGDYIFFSLLGGGGWAVPGGRAVPGPG